MLRVVRAGSPEAARLLVRSTRFDAGVDSSVASILDDVRARGDAAVEDYTRRFDHREPPYEVARERWAARADEADRGTPAARTTRSDELPVVHRSLLHLNVVRVSTELRFRWPIHVQADVPAQPIAAFITADMG